MSVLVFWYILLTFTKPGYLWLFNINEMANVPLKVSHSTNGTHNVPAVGNQVVDLFLTN